MIPGDLLSAFPHRQFHTLPGLLDSWAALPNSNPNTCVPMQGGSLHHFYDGLWYDPAERRTHDLLCERRTRYRLSQTDTVNNTCIETYSSKTTLKRLQDFHKIIENLGIMSPCTGLTRPVWGSKSSFDKVLNSIITTTSTRSITH